MHALPLPEGSASALRSVLSPCAWCFVSVFGGLGVLDVSFLIMQDSCCVYARCATHSAQLRALTLPLPLARRHRVGAVCTGRHVQHRAGCRARQRYGGGVVPQIRRARRRLGTAQSWVRPFLARPVSQVTPPHSLNMLLCERMYWNVLECTGMYCKMTAALNVCVLNICNSTANPLLNG